MLNSAILNKIPDKKTFSGYFFILLHRVIEDEVVVVVVYKHYRGIEAMKKNSNLREEESGFVLITALLMLLTLTMMGIAVNRTTMTEWRIAMNDRIHKQVFYEADAATELASEVLEQSIACLGFDETQGGMTLAGYSDDYSIHIEEESLGFWRNYSEDRAKIPSDSTRDLYIPANYTDGEPHTNIVIAGNTELTTGAAIMMATGYEGLAKGIGTGGAMLGYDINVQRVGRDGTTESLICIKYNHLLGSEGECHY